MGRPAGQESGLLAALLELADTLLGDFDIVDMTTMLAERCVALLEVEAAGLVLSDGRGGLQVMASTTEATHRLEVHQVKVGEGPCVEAFRSGRPVSEPDLADTVRWPLFVPVARAAGHRAVHAMPLEVRGQVIGALNLFAVTAEPVKISV